MSTNLETAYLNGQFLPLSEARISPLDRGFLFADGVYEVIPVYAGQAFRLNDHLRRLEQSLQGIRLPNPLSRQQWQAMIVNLIEQNGAGEQAVYLQVTRGSAVRNHAFPKNCPATIFAMSNQRQPVAPIDLATAGVCAITAEDIRWHNCHLKTIALLPNILLRQQAVDAGCFEAILVRDGMVTEGAASNVFIVENERLLTPPADHLVLPGITRDVVLELAASAGVTHGQEPLSRERLQTADEIWLTSSTRELVPVIRLDDKDVGDGHAGPLWLRMQTCYRHFTDRLRQGKGQQL